MRPGARREASAVPSSLYPDCEETVARFQPSAPAFDRICWPSVWPEALAGSLSGVSPSTYRRWGISPRP